MSIFGDRVTVPSDASSAAWLLSGVGESSTVGALVPSGFERHAFVRRSPSDEVDDEGAELASELAVLAQRHTSTPDLIWYAIWEGYGWETVTELYAAPSGPLAWVSRVRERRKHRGAVRERGGRVREGLAEVPSFDLPLRRYFLVRGPLESVSVIARPDGFGFQVISSISRPPPTRPSAADDGRVAAAERFPDAHPDEPDVVEPADDVVGPDLWWPQDRSWFVASDTDLHWSYIGGSDDFVGRVLEAIPGRSHAVARTDPITSLP